jgi:hypothetical protein
MSAKALAVTATFAALSFAGSIPAAEAQSPPAAAPGGAYASRAHPRIEVNPRPLLYRRCVDWYELQYRPSGTVLFPAQHCWWVRG